MSIIDLSSQMYMPISAAFTKAGGGTLAATVTGATGAATKALDTVTGLLDVSTTEAMVKANQAYGAIEQGIKFIGEIFTDDTNFTDYMSVLASLGVAENIYPFRKLRLRLLRAQAEWSTHYSAPAMAMAYGDSFVAQFPKIFIMGNDAVYWQR